MLKIKRVYEPPAKEDGRRILVERLWPRGLTKEKAKIDLWLKDIAPSPALRVWFGHDPAKWRVFRRRYAAELKRRRALVHQVRAKTEAGRVTFVYAARDAAHNSAVVLKEIVERQAT